MSATQRMERIEADMMDPLYSGGYVETTIEKYAHMCCGCGLVWSRLGQARECEARGHKPTYQVQYATGPITNGVPRFVRYYDRAALRREPIADVAEDLEYAEQRHSDRQGSADLVAEAADRLLDEYEQLCDRADALLDEYQADRRLVNLAKLSKGIYRVSLNGREGRLGIDHVNLQLVPSEQYGSVKIAEYHGESVGRIDKHGTVRLWADCDPKSVRTIAVLAALEIVLGSHDPIAYAKAYACESGTCWRCGADLLDELSRELLLGPDCFRAEHGMTQRAGRAAGLGGDSWVAEEVDDDQVLDSDPHDVDVLSAV